MTLSEFQFTPGWREPPASKRFLHDTEYNWLQLVSWTAAAVEVITKLDPLFVEWFNQGNHGSCTGFGGAKLMAAINLPQLGPMHYDGWQEYCWACQHDNDPSTTCQKDLGSYSFATLDCLRQVGPYVFGKGWDLAQGIASYSWITANYADGVRTAISLGKLVGTGGPWFNEWLPGNLIQKNGRYWLPPKSKWKKVAGGHFFGWYDALDSIQAFGLSNTWGSKFPEKVYMDMDDFNYWMSLGGSDCAVLVDKDWIPPSSPSPSVSPSPSPSPSLPAPIDTRTMKNMSFKDENDAVWKSKGSITFEKQ